MRPGRLDLGVGIVAAPGIDLLWDGIADLVDVIEVEPQVIWRPKPEGRWSVDRQAMSWLASRDRPILCHGVGFPIGGSAPPDRDAVELFAHCVRRLGARHASEHVAFARAADGPRLREAGFSLPPPQTWAAVESAIASIGIYQERLEVPFLIENGVNYLPAHAGDLDDGHYLAAIADSANCGILLDLHNLWTNERNGHQCIEAVLNDLPLDRVAEVHVAAGFHFNGIYLDAHAGVPEPALLAILARVLPRLPKVRAVVFEAVAESLLNVGASGVRAALADLQRIVALSRDHGTEKDHQHAPSRQAGPIVTVDDRASTAGRELALLNALAANDPLEEACPGIDTLRLLTDQARLGGITANRPEVIRALLDRLGPAATNDLLRRYLRAREPHLFTCEEANSFDTWLRAVDTRR